MVWIKISLSMVSDCGLWQRANGHIREIVIIACIQYCVIQRKTFQEFQPLLRDHRSLRQIVAEESPAN